MFTPSNVRALAFLIYFMAISCLSPSKCGIFLNKLIIQHTFLAYSAPLFRVITKKWRDIWRVFAGIAWGLAVWLGSSWVLPGLWLACRVRISPGFVRGFVRGFSDVSRATYRKCKQVCRARKKPKCMKHKGLCGFLAMAKLSLQPVLIFSDSAFCFFCAFGGGLMVCIMWPPCAVLLYLAL